MMVSRDIDLFATLITLMLDADHGTFVLIVSATLISGPDFINNMGLIH